MSFAQPLLFSILRTVNLRNLPRDIVIPLQTTGETKLDTAVGLQANTFIGLDFAAYNQDTSDHKFYLDGREFVVAAGSNLDLNSIVFTSIRLEANSGGWIVQIAGISVDLLRALVGG